MCFVYFRELSSSISITMADKQVSFSYSLNNIRMHSLKSYKIKLYDQTNTFIERLKWKVHFFKLNNKSNYTPISTNNYYKLPTSTYAPFYKTLSTIEDELLLLVIKWKLLCTIITFKSKYVQTSRRYTSRNKYIHFQTRLVKFINIDPRIIRNYYMIT